MNITKKAIDGIEYNGKTQDIRWDDRIKGFGVRVYPTGLKAFVLTYRHNGRKHIVALGRYGILTVDQARDLAIQKLAELTKGNDPYARNNKAISGKTFTDLCADYVERHASSKKTGHEDVRRIHKHLLPLWKKLEVSSITSEDVAALHHKITKTGSGYEANRVITLVHTLFDKAKEWGYLERGIDNPAKGIKLNAEKKRDRWITPTELPRLAKAIDEETNFYASKAIWMYLLTGMRKSELLKLQWTDVDFERHEIRLEDTKAGRIHYIPLSQEAFQILHSIPRIDDNPFIFCGHKKGSPLINIQKPWNRVKIKAGVEDARLHDLRRTVGSWLAQSGNSLHLVGRVLGHSNASTTQIYARFGQDHVREALEAHGKRIMGVAGKTPMADVVELRRAK
ncbi:MAG: site-specific integrase [Nitrospinae bacterium]|nr:site-specific integrase [Nitrospinota bacterium]